MTESFEEMALRIAKEIDYYFALKHSEWAIQLATRIREELCKKQKPVAWVQDVIYPMLPEFAFSWVKTQLHDIPLYSGPTSIPADMEREGGKEMTDIVTYLRNLASPDPYDERPVMHSKELYEAADTIETLRRERDMWKETDLRDAKRIDELSRELEAMKQERDFFQKESIEYLSLWNSSVEMLAASQAREQQLREALDKIVRLPYDEVPDHHQTISMGALALPTDDTALKQYGAKLLRQLSSKVDVCSCETLLQTADELENRNA